MAFFLARSDLEIVQRCLAHWKHGLIACFHLKSKYSEGKSGTGLIFSSVRQIKYQKSSLYSGKLVVTQNICVLFYKKAVHEEKNETKINIKTNREIIIIMKVLLYSFKIYVCKQLFRSIQDYVIYLRSLFTPAPEEAELHLLHIFCFLGGVKAISMTNWGICLWKPSLSRRPRRRALKRLMRKVSG